VQKAIVASRLLFGDPTVRPKFFTGCLTEDLI
jgi:hypothetical protein